MAVASLKLEACQEVANEIAGPGRRAFVYACHVARWAALDVLVEPVYGEFGRIEVLVNNAGMSPVAGLPLETTEELVDKVLAVNFQCPFRLGPLVGTRMRAAGGGCIINVTSIGAIRPLPSIAPNAGAEAALNALTKAHALEYGPKVRVNAIMADPFWADVSEAWREDVDRTIDSAARPIRRSTEIITTALDLASDHASHTTGSIVEPSGDTR